MTQGGRISDGDYVSRMEQVVLIIAMFAAITLLLIIAIVKWT